MFNMFQPFDKQTAPRKEPVQAPAEAKGAIETGSPCPDLEAISSHPRKHTPWRSSPHAPTNTQILNDNITLRICSLIRCEVSMSATL